jgi:glycosyltransferase involved in cell wall biosynthesis
MNLLLVCERYAPEARSVAHLFQDLAEGLLGKGHRVTVVTKRSSEFAPKDEKERAEMEADLLNGVRVKRVSGPFDHKGPIWMRAVEQVVVALRILAACLKTPEVDAIIVYSPPLPLAITGVLFSLFRRVSFLLNLHDIYPRTPIELGALKNPILIGAAEILEDLIYRNTRQFLVPNRHSVRYLVEEKNIHPSKVHLVYNWIDMTSISPGRRDNAFSEKHGLANKFVVSYAGVLGYAQDMTATIECAGRLAELEDIQFLLVGDGAQKEKWEKMGADIPRLKFITSVERKDYVELLRASDVCLVALSKELRSPALPGKIQSIMAVGKPILAVVPEGEASRIILESDCGLVVSAGDAKAIETALRTLYADPDLRRRLGENGRKYAEKHFQLTDALDRINDLIEGGKP